VVHGAALGLGTQEYPTTRMEIERPVGFSLART
jgi:hypothetical protein